MILRLKKYSGFLAGFFFWGEAMAQEITTEPVQMVTDRPDVTESARIVTQRCQQVGSGRYYESFREVVVPKDKTYY
ncbi:MAG: hypothetical protein MUO53_05240 [Maribacter sp.]|nr:hypothetical protein [Maribacter sp.]